MSTILTELTKKYFLGMLNELDLRTLWKELDSYEKELESETRSLQEVWLKIAQLKSKNEMDMKQ